MFLGVGDVCSFAQMDVKKHGNPMFLSDEITEANDMAQAEDGKTEKSLINFKVFLSLCDAMMAFEHCILGEISNLDAITC
jgi:hypothetical protein